MGPALLEYDLIKLWAHGSCTSDIRYNVPFLHPVEYPKPFTSTSGQSPMRPTLRLHPPSLESDGSPSERETYQRPEPDRQPHPVPLELELEPLSLLTAAPESAEAHPFPSFPPAFSTICQNHGKSEARLPLSGQQEFFVWRLASKSQMKNMLKRRWGKSCLSLPSQQRSDEAAWNLGSPRSRLLPFKSGSMFFYQLSSRPMHIHA